VCKYNFPQCASTLTPISVRVHLPPVCEYTSALLRRSSYRPARDVRHSLPLSDAANPAAYSSTARHGGHRRRTGLTSRPTTRLTTYLPTRDRTGSAAGAIPCLHDAIGRGSVTPAVYAACQMFCAQPSNLSGRKARPHRLRQRSVRDRTIEERDGAALLLHITLIMIGRGGRPVPMLRRRHWAARPDLQVDAASDLFDQHRR
jgi:hypothetical protein